MPNVTKEEVLVATEELDARIAVSRDKRRRTSELEADTEAFARDFYRMLAQVDETYREALMDRFSLTNLFSTLLDHVDESLELRPCLLDAIRDAQ